MKLNKKSIFTILISIIFVFFAFHNIDGKKLLDTFHMFNYKILFLTVPLYIFTIILRGIRWKILITDNKKLKILELSEIYTAGSALNIYLPARAGDFFRAYFLGKKYSRPKLEILGSVVLERIFDGLTVLLILLIAMFAYYRTPWMIKLSAITAVVFIGSLVGGYLLFKFNKINEFCDFLKMQLSKLPRKFAVISKKIVDKLNVWLNSFINGFEPISNPKNMINSTLLSLAIWTIDCVLIYVLITNFGFNVNFSISLFVISFIALSTIIPSTSVYIGPYQYAFIMALGIYHINKSSALAIAFMLQSTTIILLSTISIIFFIRNNINYKNINYERTERIEKTETPAVTK